MSKRVSHLHIETGPGGWLKALWRREAGEESAMFVRFREPQREGEGWTIIGIQTPKESRLHTALMLDFPRHVIESAVNADDGFKAELLAALDKRIPSDLDSAFQRKYRKMPRLKLERPASHKLDDSFFRDVAIAYRQAVASGLPPLKTMADDSGVPQGTIARWVAKARELGLLPPTEPGKVST